MSVFGRPGQCRRATEESAHLHRLPGTDYRHNTPPLHCSPTLGYCPYSRHHIVTRMTQDETIKRLDQRRSNLSLTSATDVACLLTRRPTAVLGFGTWLNVIGVHTRLCPVIQTTRLLRGLVSSPESMQIADVRKPMPSVQSCIVTTPRRQSAKLKSAGIFWCWPDC